MTPSCAIDLVRGAGVVDGKRRSLSHRTIVAISRDAAGGKLERVPAIRDTRGQRAGAILKAQYALAAAAAFSGRMHRGNPAVAAQKILDGRCVPADSVGLRAAATNAVTGCASSDAIACMRPSSNMSSSITTAAGLPW
jgi:hypothetical protein